MTPNNDNTAQPASPTLNAQAQSVGTVLREARESTSQSIAQIAARLRIKAEYLQALEDDRQDNLPGRVYAIGFLRSYGTYLDLDPLDLIRRYKAVASTTPEGGDLSFPKPTAPRRQSPELPAIAVSVVVVGAILFGWYYFGGDNNPLTVHTSLNEPPSLNEPASNQTLSGERPSRTNGVLPAHIASTTTVRAAVPVVRKLDDPTDEPGDGIAAGLATTPPQTETAAADAEVIETEPATAAAPTPSDTTIQALLPTLGVVRPVAPPRTTKRPDSVAEQAEKQVAEQSDTQDNQPLIAEVEDVPGDTEETETRQVAAAPVVEDAPAVQSPTTVPDPAPQVVASLPQSPAPETVAPETVAAEPVSREVVTVEPFTQVAPPVVGAAPPADEVIAPREFGQVNRDSRIVLTARTEIWVQVRDSNGADVFTKMLGKGESYRVPNRTGLRLQTGNAGALDVFVDGQRAPSLGAFGTILRDLALVPEQLAKTTAQKISPPVDEPNDEFESHTR